MVNKLRLTSKSYILMDQAVVSGSALVTQLLIAGNLGMAAYGKFSAIVLVQLFLLSIQQSAITGMYQVVYPSIKSNDQSNYTNGVWTIEACALVVVSLIGIITYSICSFGLTKMAFLSASVYAVLFLLQDFFRRVLLARNEFKKALAIDIINNVLQLGILLLLVGIGCLNFLAALWVCALTFIPAIVLSAFWLKPAVRIGQMNFAFKRHGTEAIWMAASALVQWFSGNFYIVTAGAWLGPVILGVLRLGQYIFGLINVLLQAVENYVLPRAGSLSHSSTMTIGYLKNIQKKMLFSMGSGLLLIAILAKPTLRFINAEHIQELLTVIYGMCGVYLLVIISYPIRIALRSLKLSKAFFAGYVINSIFSFATAYLFIHQWGILGVLAGLFFSQALLFIFWIGILQNKFNIIWK